MTLVDACCNTPPTNAQWQPTGYDKILANRVNEQECKVYRNGPKDSKRGLIALTDIFGFHPTTCQFLDLLAVANGGFQLSAPHIFDPMPRSLLADRPAMMAWLDQNADYKKNHIYEIIRVAVEDLRADGCTTFSIVGQCWGAYLANQAASEEGQPFLATGGPHPSVTNIETVKDVKCPLILLPSKDEPDMIPVIESVKHKNFPVESFQKRFENVGHGWTGGRGDWSDPEQLKAGVEAIELLAQYFAKVSEVAQSSK
ncbi:hypothetical protein EDD21DRAFT_443343 [Dissophora ornata]|nr:hypothetical protein BGZ58_001604 [Dissophora ornata]KAI8601868.1 hypothetical protein EDD21DRAFT_443343 [Dissophora ornata]